jgi:hypothetical protein
MQIQRKAKSGAHLIECQHDQVVNCRWCRCIPSTRQKSLLRTTCQFNRGSITTFEHAGREYLLDLETGDAVGQHVAPIR